MQLTSEFLRVAVEKKKEKKGKKNEQGQDIQVGEGIQRESEELHKDRKGKSREGPSVFLQGPPQQEEGHAISVD